MQAVVRRTPPKDTHTGLRSLLKYAGKGDSKIALVFGVDARACGSAVRHLRAGAPEIPVWLFTTIEPGPEIRNICERVIVDRSRLRLLLAAERRSWPFWVAISAGQWTGERGGVLKAAPFLVPPFRAVLQNARGDFFAGRPGPVLRHWLRVMLDAASAAWNGTREASHSAGDAFRSAAHVVELSALMTAGTVLRWAGYPHFRWFVKFHGAERLEVQPAVTTGAGVLACPAAGATWNGDDLRRATEASYARWIQWGAPGPIEDLLPLFENPRTFAVSRQRHFRAWKPMPVPMAPFRTLQPGEASQVLAPVSDTIVVDRAKLIALGIPAAAVAETGWMLLFWKAAAAGWRSYSVGQEKRLREQPDFPLQETAFVSSMALDPSLRRLGPHEPELARGSVAFPIAQGAAAPAPTQKLRVLIVSPFLPYPLSHGGAVRIWNLCRALADRVDFVLIAVHEKDELVYYAKLSEVFRRVYAVDIDQRALRDGTLPAQVRSHQSSALRAAIADVVRDWRPDVLQVEYTHMAHFRDAAPGIPAVLVEHDLTYHLYRQLAESRRDAESIAEHGRWLEFERRWLAAYDGVWTVSEEDRVAAVAESGRAYEDTFSIPNGVDVERFVPAEHPAGRHTGTPFPQILFVGGFRHLPNVIGFEKLEREVMPRVWARFPDARLQVVAGPRHEQFWKKRALDPRIEMHGFVEDLRPLYAGAAVAVAPLEVSAGTNIKVLEAMACGKPIVTTPVGCAGLQLQDGYDALIRPDWGAFADAVAALLDDAGLRRAIGVRARMTAVDRFSWRAIADKAYESYCALKVAAPTCTGSV